MKEENGEKKAKSQGWLEMQISWEAILQISPTKAKSKQLCVMYLTLYQWEMLHNPPDLCWVYLTMCRWNITSWGSHLNPYKTGIHIPSLASKIREKNEKWDWKQTNWDGHFYVEKRMRNKQWIRKRM